MCLYINYIMREIFSINKYTKLYKYFFGGSVFVIVIFKVLYLFFR